jgi:elongation factor 2
LRDDDGRNSRQGYWNTYFELWQPVPTNMPAPLVESIRKRKGLPLEPPKASEFIDNE